MKIKSAARVHVGTLDQFDTPIMDKRLPYREQFLSNPGGFWRKLRGTKFDPKYPTAKYVVITMLKENDYITMRGNSKCRIRKYALGVLTTDNYFYFNQFRTYSMYMAKNTVALIYNLFLRPYNFNVATRFLLSDNMIKLDDPISQFVVLISGINGSYVHHAGLLGKCALINKVHGCIPGLIRVKNFRECDIKPLVQAVLDRRMLIFAEDHPEMIDAVKKYLSGEKRRIDAIGELESLTGTLFLQCKDLMGGRWTNQMIAKGLEWKKTNEQEALESTLSKLVESGESI